MKNDDNKKTCRHATCEGVCRRVKTKTVKKPMKKTPPKKAKKVKLVPVPKLLMILQKQFNLWIRTRDAGQPCISCGSLNANQAGHYFPVGRFSALRFHPDNCALQCPFCNLYAYGNQAMYRIGLVKRIGVLAVEALEREAIETPIKKWSRSEVEELLLLYRNLNKERA